MKRIITFTSSAMLLLMGLCTSCQKDLGSPDEKGAAVSEVVVRATIAGNGTKVTFVEDNDGEYLKASWETDDHIVGWDENGNAIELAVASIDNGTAIFKTVSGSIPTADNSKVYMIYAPDKHYSDITGKTTLEYNLSTQSLEKVPALMTATGTVSGGVLELTFANRLAIMALKNPTFQVTEATNITGLKLSGDNILTKATFSVNGENVDMNSSDKGEITRSCNITTDADGTTDKTVYFAVLPNNTQAGVTISTTNPTGYQIEFSGKSFNTGYCYLLAGKTLEKQKFTITVNSVENGTVTTSHSGSVAWGTEVTVNPTPNPGFELESITWTPTGGSAIGITSDKKFIMPQANVIVAVTFKASVPGEINGTEMEEGDNNW